MYEVGEKMLLTLIFCTGREDALRDARNEKKRICRVVACAHRVVGCSILHTPVWHALDSGIYENVSLRMEISYTWRAHSSCVTFISTHTALPAAAPAGKAASRVYIVMCVTL